MKNILTFIITLIVIVACRNPKADNTSTIENEKLVQEYFEHFNNHDWTKMAKMYSDTAEFKDPTLGQGIVKQTRQQTMDKYAELHKTFSDIHDRVIQIYPSGEKNIIVEFVSTGTAPDSSKFELPICTIFTIENGLITKDFSYFDNFEEP